MRFWVGTLSAFGAGLGIGVGLGMLLVEDKVRKEYEESAASYRRAMAMARDIDAEKPAENEAVLITATNNADIPNLQPGPVEIVDRIVDIEGVNVGGVTLKPVLAEDNPYHTPPNPTPTDTFVEGKPNEWGVSYIEEEEYDEEDGRTKYQVNYYVDDQQQTVFIMGGAPIDDWAERLGESIVVDFYKLIPPGAPDILYVRNHKTDEDYEVTFGMP